MRLTDKDGNNITLRQMHDRISDMLEIPDMDAGVQHDYAMFREMLEEASDGGVVATESGVLAVPPGWRTVPPPGRVICSDRVARTHAEFAAWLKPIPASVFENGGAVNVTDGEPSETFIARARGEDHIGDGNEMIGKPAAPVWRSMDDTPEDGRKVLVLNDNVHEIWFFCYATDQTKGRRLWMEQNEGLVHPLNLSPNTRWTELPAPPEVKP